MKICLFIALVLFINACGTKTSTEQSSVEDKYSDDFTIQKRNVPSKTTGIQEVTAQKQPEKEETKWENAPDFTVNAINDRTITLSQFKGKVIILDFWATWCPPCRAEIPDFIELYNQYKDKGLVIIGLSMDRREETVQKFIENNKINYPIGMANSKIVRDYGGIRGIPTTFVIDRNGNIIEKFEGFRPKATFKTAINKLL